MMPKGFGVIYRPPIELCLGLVFTCLLAPFFFSSTLVLLVFLQMFLATNGSA
jgi:hypothetical protein